MDDWPKEGSNGARVNELLFNLIEEYVQFPAPCDELDEVMYQYLGRLRTLNRSWFDQPAAQTVPPHFPGKCPVCNHPTEA